MSSSAAEGDGRLEAIWLKRMKGGPMDSRQRVRTLAGRGLEGNANLGGRRQVIVIEAEKWEEMGRELGVTLDPAIRRGNLLVRGLDLADSRGRHLRVGSCRIEILGESKGCKLMEETQIGLQQALRQDWRGGAFGRVLDDGEIAVGDPVTLE